MFTGLIQDVGTVAALRREGRGVVLKIRTRLAAEMALGDSIAVNGVCLTASQRDDTTVEVTAVGETIARSALDKVRSGTRCNLELAVKLGQAMGGHWVQGHVDGVGNIERVTPVTPGCELKIRCEQALLRYVVEKGSIAVDGVSLTVSELTAQGFAVALVPHTLAATTLSDAAVGQQVNIETDILAKYLEKLTGPLCGSQSNLNEKTLREAGFI